MPPLASSQALTIRLLRLQCRYMWQSFWARSRQSVHIAILRLNAIRNDAARPMVFHDTGGWGEAWALPLAVLPIAVVLGFLGGVLGRTLSDAAVVPCDEMR